VKNHFLHGVVALSVAFGVGAAHADDCDSPKTSEQVAQCLGVELRESDAKINTMYKQVMEKIGDAEKTDLRLHQRKWIKERDSACQLNSKETNREKWYQELLKDYAKTVCVTRFTNRRTSELEKMLAYVSRPQHEQSKAAPPVPVYPRAVDKAYDSIPPTSHATGKWYFELGIDPHELVPVGPCAITAGAWDKHLYTGQLINVRARNANDIPVRIGLAVDLDNGKLYISLNGEWPGGAPGGNGGLDLKLGRDYFAIFTTSAEDITPYLERKALVPNFGDRAMAYALPAGYRPWKDALK
jgi:uncharacterized protein YecT (DUF1311 family)